MQESGEGRGIAWVIFHDLSSGLSLPRSSQTSGMTQLDRDLGDWICGFAFYSWRNLRVLSTTPISRRPRLIPQSKQKGAFTCHHTPNSTGRWSTHRKGNNIGSLSWVGWQSEFPFRVMHKVVCTRERRIFGYRNVHFHSFPPKTFISVPRTTS